MAFVFPAALALLSSSVLYPHEDHGAIKRAIFYGQRIEGWALVQQIKTGMPETEVQRIMSNRLCLRGASMTHVDDHFAYHGVTVIYDDPQTEPMRLSRIQWQWQWWK
jgi:hypothetical protein